MKHFYFILTAIFIFAISCEQAKNEKSGKMNVVVTTSMIADAVQEIGGDAIEVHALMGPGVDPHLYKATANDTKKLAEADIIIYNGLHLEGKMGDILTKMGRQKPVYTVSEDISPKRLREPAEFEGLYDPHIWFDVSLWKEAVKKITNALIDIDAENTKIYTKNSESYIEQLDELHLWVKEQINKIPKQGRVLVTAHDAFGYFGDAYDVEVLGLQGISTVTESGIQDIERIIKVMVDRKVNAIFVESSVSKKGVEAVVERCKELGHDLKVGGSLYSDAMGEMGTPEGKYIGMVKHNVKTIVSSLVTNE